MKKAFNVIGILAGIVIIICGLYLIFQFDVHYLGDLAYGYTFGADFYTEQYSATMKAANNIKELGEYLDEVFSFASIGMGLITASIGAAITCYFGSKLCDMNEAANTIPKAAANEPAASEDVIDSLPDL